MAAKSVANFAVSTLILDIVSPFMIPHNKRIILSTYNTTILFLFALHRKAFERKSQKPATASTVAGSVLRLKLPVIPDISQVSSAADVLLSQY